MDHSDTREFTPEREPRRRIAAHIKDAVSDADDAFRQGDLEHLTTATLRTHLLTLANQPANDVKHRDVIRSLILNHLLLQRQIDRLSRRTAFQRWLVGALAFAALLGAVVDIAMTLTREPAPAQALQPPAIQREQ